MVNTQEGAASDQDMEASPRCIEYPETENRNPAEP
jgi:hypothetical protein